MAHHQSQPSLVPNHCKRPLPLNIRPLARIRLPKPREPVIAPPPPPPLALSSALITNWQLISRALRRLSCGGGGKGRKDVQLAALNFLCSALRLKGDKTMREGTRRKSAMTNAIRRWRRWRRVLTSKRWELRGHLHWRASSVFASRVDNIIESNQQSAL